MFDFVTNLWPGAQRAPANLPPAHPPERSIDDPWKIAGTPSARKRKGSGKRQAKVRPPSPPANGVDAVILALITTSRGRSGPWRLLTVTELADAMACSVGEASKRVKQADEAEGVVWSKRDGRRKMVGLHRVSAEKWQEIVSSSPMRAVGMYRLATSPRRREDAAVIHSSS